MDIGKVKPQEITDEMRESYLDYAMSVIVSRALPDVRDGLKPVHRRILYAMNELGLRSGNKHRKSATVVGEVLGKYHPHGDSSVYDALTRLAQDFSLRYPLINGQGNFGSMDGDAPAAMRYTEVKMFRLAEEMLRDIDKETVEWNDNYDATRKEPTVLPARVPQLLLNGSVGIAVGMATNIPPHNLIEVVDGLTHLIDNPSATNEDLVKFVKGPDFPTGGEIYSKKDILHAYATGKGPIVARGKADIIENEDKKGGLKIIISEITYQVNKATLLETIANLVKNKKLEGIRDVRDESDKDGVRILIELKNDAQPQKILNKLWKLTDMQKTFHLNMLALADGIQPQVFSLKSVLELYLEHRKEIVERRAKYDLKKAEERAHILEGLTKALKNINAVIETIKKSPTKEQAHEKLMKKFTMSEKQATAILEMRLQTLAGLEQKKITDELKEKQEIISDLKDLLKKPERVKIIIKDELKETKELYGDERRTKIFSQKVGDIAEEDLIEKEEVIIALTQNGFIKRLSPNAWQAQKRGGVGKKGAEVSEEDVSKHLIVANSHDNILFFTSSGKVFKTKAYEIPPSTRTSKGRALVNFLDISSDEDVTAIISLKPGADKEQDKFLVMVTRDGIIKKTSLADFANVRSNGLISIKLKKSDRLKWVKATGGTDEIILVSKKGQAIRTKESDVRSMGRTAAGVIGMKLREGDQITGMDIVVGGKKSDEAKLLIVFENGFGKKTKIKHYKTQRRGGVGIKTARISEKTGNVVSARILHDEETDLIAISKKGIVIRTPLSEISELGRATQGVRIMRFKKGDGVASIITL